MAGAIANVVGGLVSDNLVKKLGLKAARRIVPFVGLFISAVCLALSTLVSGRHSVLALLSLSYCGMNFPQAACWAVCLDIGGGFAGAVSGARNTGAQAASAPSLRLRYESNDHVGLLFLLYRTMFAELANASGEAGEVEARLRRFDGEYRWFLFRAVPVRDDQGEAVRWYGTSTDIENLKRAEEKLRQDERELRQIVDTVAQLVIFLRPDGSALHANRFTLEYTGLSLEDFKAQDFRDRVFHPDDIERLREERRKALLRGIPFENEQRARRKDGQYRWFFIRYNAVLDEKGNPVRWYAAGIDIEDRKRADFLSSGDSLNSE